MKISVLSTTESAAHGAKLAGVEIVPHFPAPFSVEIAKTLSKIHNCDIFDVSAAGDGFAAAIGSAAGRRTFLPVSSPFSYEVLAAPFMRLPFVAVNMSRSQHGIKVDHTSVMALRDAGYLMFFPETNQEIYDTVIQAYKICEDQKVMLPAIINVDGMPSFMEPVQLVNDQSVKTFLPKYKSRLDMKKSFHLDIYSSTYGNGKLQMNKAMENVIELTNKVNEQWKQKFRRSYGLVEHYMMEDGETVIVTMGYHSSTAKAAVKRMRAEGKKVGLLRVRVFRPWPRDAVAKALETVKKVVVFEQAISIGVGGILSAHIKRPVSQLICLGKYPSEKDFMEAVSRVEKSDKDLKLWL